MPRSIVFSLLISFLALTGCSSTDTRPATASNTPQPVTSEGSALIGTGGIDHARLKAIDAATANAAEQIGSGQGGNLSISDLKVVDEWQQDGVYHVQLLVVPSDKKLCASRYRKRLVATAFPMASSEQLSGTESQDLYIGIPREIGNRLMETGGFISRNLTHVSLYSRPDLAPEVQPRNDGSHAGILTVAEQQNAQFVLSGVIRDFSIESTEYVRGSGLLSGLKWAMRDLVGRRSIGIDVYMHDGLSGALLFQHRYTDSIVGDISLPSGYNVGSERFDSTPAGHAITQLIQQAAEDIHSLMGCYPFATRITQVQGSRIEIAAGAQDKIRRGDRMKVFASVSNDRGKHAIAADALGILTITDVNATTAIGSLDSPAAVKAGDWIKSEN